MVSQLLLDTSMEWMSNYNSAAIWSVGGSTLKWCFIRDGGRGGVEGRWAGFGGSKLVLDFFMFCVANLRVCVFFLICAPIFHTICLHFENREISMQVLRASLNQQKPVVFSGHNATTSTFGKKTWRPRLFAWDGLNWRPSGGAVYLPGFEPRQSYVQPPLCHQRPLKMPAPLVHFLKVNRTITFLINKQRGCIEFDVNMYIPNMFCSNQWMPATRNDSFDRRWRVLSSRRPSW